MKRTILAFVFSSAACWFASAIGVDVEELKSVRPIEFVNYTGPVNIFQTDWNIRGIGRDLAAQVKRGGLTANRGLKYSVIHAVGPEQPDRLAADIMSIDKDARVDHIANVRRIASAYIEGLYGYPRKDSDLLALFVSYYNAVYRGNLGYFKGKYKTVVLAYLHERTVGISTKYYEWPGNTELVIPLSEKAARTALGALNTSELTAKAVVEQLAAREDKGLPERKAIVELKQKEVEKGRALIDEEARKLEEQKRKTAEQRAALEQAKAEGQQPGTEGERRTGERVAIQEQEIVRQEQEQKATEEKIAAQEKAVEEKRAEIVEEKKGIARDETALAIAENPEEVRKELAQREEEVAKREEIAKKGETDAAVLGGRLYYLKIKEFLTGGHYNNDMLILNAATGKVLLKSTEAKICGRKFDLFKSGVVVISYKADHASGHFLTLLDLDTLSRKAVSDEPVFYRGFVETRDDLTYAIVDRGKSYFLGKFDANMKMLAVSKEPVDGDSFISFYGDLVYINREDKKILVLNRADLSTASVVEP
jgi:hypothetical protein